MSAVAADKSRMNRNDRTRLRRALEEVQSVLTAIGDAAGHRGCSCDNGCRVSGCGRHASPFGDKVSKAMTNYNRATPFIGSAGTLKDGAVAEAKSLGFSTIVDLRTPPEGTASEQTAVEAVGLTYVNIPVANQAPTDQQVADFARLVEDNRLYPMLVHCQSANRVGAMWTLYRTSKGVPATVAIEEGRTLGMKPSREQAVRQRLGLPALKE